MIYTNFDINYQYYLAHHGILGMKWGKRNGPPYPLSIKDHNKVVKKSLKGKKSGTAYVTKDATYGAIPIHEVQNPNYMYRTDVATIKNMNPVINPNIFNSGNAINPYLQRCNPAYNIAGGRNNCAKCSTTMSLMKMGYNHIQAGLADRPLKLGCESEWFTNAKLESTNKLSDIYTSLKSVPNGSFGTMSLGRTDSIGNRISGHSLAWTKLRDGSFRIEDGQSGKQYNNFLNMVNDLKFSSGTTATFCNLTNAKPNWRNLELDGVISIQGNKGFQYNLQGGKRVWKY